MSLAGLDTLITAGSSQGSSALFDFIECGNYMINAGYSIGQENWANASQRLISAGDSLNAAANHLLQDSLWVTGLKPLWRDALRLIDTNWPVGGGTDMDAILTAMISASFEQLTSFMGITQAYKVAVWDAPFNEEYYEALARGFKTWGA